MRKLNTTPPSPGLCFLQNLPDPYQTAFRQGSAQHLPGEFLPVEVDWFSQVFMLPFGLMYALPPISIPVVFVIQLVQKPESFRRIYDTIKAQSLGEMAFTIGLLLLIVLLLVYCAWIAWDLCSSFVRTWQASRSQRRDEQCFGLVMLERGLVARLIDNIESRNCLWLPREAIANILWQEMREEGAKRSRWVYRTRLCYVTERRGKEEKRWLTLKGHMLKTGHPIGDTQGDRVLFDRLNEWWQSPP